MFSLYTCQNVQIQQIIKHWLNVLEHIKYNWLYKQSKVEMVVLLLQRIITNILFLENFKSKDVLIIL